MYLATLFISLILAVSNKASPDLKEVDLESIIIKEYSNGCAPRSEPKTEIQKPFSNLGLLQDFEYTHDEAGIPRFFAQNVLLKAWIWLFSSQKMCLDEKIPLPNANWKDTTPRFVAYGNSHVANNSLGVPDPNSLIGFSYYNIAFWTSENDAEGNVKAWTKGTKAQRLSIVKAYNSKGVRLGVSVFGADCKPQSSGNDPVKLADEIASFVLKYDLQGVDVDYEEFNQFENEKATAWLIPFTRELRSKLKRENGYHISHAPIAPLFSMDVYERGYTWLDQKIGDAIDFYNVQYYNQGKAYESCETLVEKADGGAKKTSILEFTSVWSIPKGKIVARKPAREKDANKGKGYMSPSKFAKCLSKANDAGWSAGAMWWEYRGDLQFVVQPVRAGLGLES